MRTARLAQDPDSGAVTGAGSSAQASCTISKLTRNGKVFTITDKCADIRGGGEIVGSPVAVTIASPTGFTMNKQTYRYCGPKVQF